MWTNMWIRTHYCLILRHFRSWYLLGTSYAGMCDVRVCVSIYDINIEFMSGWTIRYFFHSRPSRIPIPTNFVVCLCVRHDFSHFKRFHIYHMHGGAIQERNVGSQLVRRPESTSLFRSCSLFHLFIEIKSFLENFISTFVSVPIQCKHIIHTQHHRTKAEEMGKILFWL